MFWCIYSLNVQGMYYLYLKKTSSTNLQPTNSEVPSRDPGGLLGDLAPGRMVAGSPVAPTSQPGWVGSAAKMCACSTDLFLKEDEFSYGHMKRKRPSNGHTIIRQFEQEN